MQLVTAVYRCPQCKAERQGSTPNLSQLEENSNAWYLCWCRGDTNPTRMTSPDDPRDPGQEIKRTYTRRRVKEVEDSIS